MLNAQVAGLSKLFVASCLNVLHNYFDDNKIIFSDLYLIQFLHYTQQIYSLRARALIFFHA